ncbi:hypothetical protein QFC21_005837 [Naganishia friedmannii]|uniref:Uncharacterized protein n=1 Tax=Naganishia friedmannii TaxID=89922 RepID=A0ACC2V6Z4_9TREE|nr:hypothetical protein QFC21_005837 [Naganishia friedmannii]
MSDQGRLTDSSSSSVNTSNSTSAEERETAAQTAAAAARAAAAPPSNSARNARNAAARASREASRLTIELQEQRAERERATAALLRERERREERERNQREQREREERRQPVAEPVYISYVTGSAAGTGRWEGRVNLDLERQSLPRNHTRTTADILGVSPPAADRIQATLPERIAANDVQARERSLTVERSARRDSERERVREQQEQAARRMASTTGGRRAGKKDLLASSAAVVKEGGRKMGGSASGGEGNPARVTLRQLWNLSQSSVKSNTAVANNSTSNNNTSGTQQAPSTTAAGGGGTQQQRWTEEQLFKGIIVDYLSHAHYPGTVGVLLGVGRPPASAERGDDEHVAVDAAHTVTRTANGTTETGAAAAGKAEEEDVHMLSASTTMNTLDSSGSFPAFPSHSSLLGTSSRAMATASTTTTTTTTNGNGIGNGSANDGKSSRGRFDVRVFVKQIEWRKEIRELIISGRISDATTLIRKHFPAVLDTSKDTYKARAGSGRARSTETSGAGVLGSDEDEDMEHDDHTAAASDRYAIHDHDEDDSEEDDDDEEDDEDDMDSEANDAYPIGGGYVFGRTPIPTPFPGPTSSSMSMAVATPRQRLLPSSGNGFAGASVSVLPTPATNSTNNNTGSSSRVTTESRQPRYGAGGFPIPVAAPGGATNANAARGGAGSRFGMMTASGSSGGAGASGRSNGLAAAGSASSLGGGSSGDVQWTVHSRTASTMTTAGMQSGTMLPSSSSGMTSTSHSSDPHHLMTGLRIPAFPYARTYDRPTLLALNLDIQEFVEGLRVLQQQVPSSPSEAVSLAGSIYDEATSNGAGKSTNGGGTTIEVVTGATRSPRTTTNEHDQPMTSRPSTPNATASLSGTATRKAARDAAILACLSHAARLDSATQHLRPRESRRYAQQVQDVCGLLAYNDMEASPLAGYLEQERRVGLADMVEGCIMASTGYSAQSVLESLWQQDAYLWHPEHGHLALNDVSFSETDGKEGEDGKRMRELALVSPPFASIYWITKVLRACRKRYLAPPCPAKMNMANIRPLPSDTREIPSFRPPTTF